MGVNTENKLPFDVPVDFFGSGVSEGTRNPDARLFMARVAQYSEGGLTPKEYAEKANVNLSTAYRVLNEAVREGKMEKEEREVEGRGRNPTVYKVDRASVAER